MSIRVQSPTKSPASHSPAHSPGMALMRKCTCGGSAGILMECEGCAREKLIQHRTPEPGPAVAPAVLQEVVRSPHKNIEIETQSFLYPRFAHDFSRMAIYSAHLVPGLWEKKGTRPRPSETGRFRFGSFASLYEETGEGESPSGEPAGTTEAPTTDGETEAGGNASPGSVGGNEVQTGATNCDAASGTANAKTLNRDPCTQECSQKHEAKHAADIGPCCAKAGVASKAAKTDEDKAAVQKQFDDWMIGNRPFLECQAYAVSVSCGTAKHIKEGCLDSVRPKCCKPLVWYIRSARQEQQNFCNAADTKLSPCPWK